MSILKNYTGKAGKNTVTIELPTRTMIDGISDEQLSYLLYRASAQLKNRGIGEKGREAEGEITFTAKETLEAMTKPLHSKSSFSPAVKAFAATLVQWDEPKWLSVLDKHDEIATLLDLDKFQETEGKEQLELVLPFAEALWEKMQDLLG